MANEHEPTPEIAAAADRVIHFPQNQFTLGRFLGAREAPQSVVYVQDDDLCVHNIPAIVEAYARGPQIVANLVDDKSSRHWTWWQTQHPRWVELGFGSLFPREWAAKMFDWPYDRDLLRRKADKVFTVLNPWTAIKAGPDDITRLYHDGQESGRDANALSLRADHKPLTEIAVRLAQEWTGEAVPGKE